MNQNTEYEFHLGQRESAIELIYDYHYSKRTPVNFRVCGTLHKKSDIPWFGMGECVAACVFSSGPKVWTDLKILELSRLVRKEEVNVSLTGLISKTIKSLKQIEQGTELLISYADWTQEHHGGIYQAASWNYGYYRPARSDGFYYNGKFIPRRTAYSKWGTSSFPDLKIRFENDPEVFQFENHYDDGKHLYWKPLNKKGKLLAKSLNIDSCPYPKPNETRN